MKLNIRLPLSLLLLSFLVFSFACNNQTSEDMIDSVEYAMKKMENYNGDEKDFELKLSHKLTYDGMEFPQSAAMAMITSSMLNKGWTFGGSEEIEGGKIYKYKEEK
jgi:hypothetical protein